MKLFFIYLSFFLFFSTIETKSNLTLDNFFNYTHINSISLSPNDEYLLVQTRRPLWNLNRFENNLWLYEIVERRKKLITNQLFDSIKYQWSPSGKSIVYLIQTNDSLTNPLSSPIQSNNINSNAEKNLYIYSIVTEQIKVIPIGNDILTALTWSQNDTSIYYSSVNLNSTVDEKLKDIIRYRSDFTSNIREINLVSSKTKDLTNVPFLISELLYSSSENKLLFSSTSLMVEDTNSCQIYSLDLNQNLSISQLTNSSGLKSNLQLMKNKSKVLYLSLNVDSSNRLSNLTQQRLYSIDLTNNEIERWANDFQGYIQDYTIKSDDGIYYLGQLGINIQIYSQISSKNTSILHQGLNGSYQLIASSNNSIVFVFTSFSKAQEVYLTKNLNQIKSATLISNENSQYDDIDLPQSISYQWINPDDNQIIEGILHYPPGRFQQKNLPLFVLIHGGPTGASLNNFLGDWYDWAPLAASEGWLVFEPNYRGSTGYGDRFVNDIRYEIIIRPSQDILSGVDQLIKDETVDKTKLTIGGYSYGGILTNWLITQTTRFNAAVSGAGSVEQVSFWGTQDTPAYFIGLIGSYPWENPQLYENQSPIYYFNRIRTPTHIVAGTADVRVPFSQSIMLERSLRYLQIPVELLLLPGEGHVLSNNPWHGKIKVQQEIEWLKLYGFNSTITNQK